MKLGTLRSTAILLASLLTLLACAGAAAQDEASDPPVGEQDAQDVLGDRASPPDLSEMDPPAGIRQSDNAGSANFSTSVEQESEIVTESHESSSSFSMGDESSEGRNSHAPVAGEIDNQPPPPPGWPGSRHANRSAANSQGEVISIKAGPIWNNDDARGKCPNVCGKKHLDWTGDWRTVGFNKSVCDCSENGYAENADNYVPGPGTYCEAPANHQCSGCSVNCPGNKIAHCTQGDRGIFTGEGQAICATAAKCVCK